MFQKKICFLTILLLMLVSLSGCANRNSSGNSSTLVHGFGTSSQDVAPTGDVKVIRVKPDVVAIHDGRADKLQPGMMVPASAILKSDENGSAELVFSSGAKVNISPNSEIALSSVSPAAASRQTEGAGKGLSRKLSSVFGRTGESSTKQATIGVRGLK